MPIKTITHTLEALNSKRDTFGNCYWALRMTDHQTGQTVEGTVSGGESNIRGILRHWNRTEGWDDGVQFNTRELPIREFNRLTKSWPYAGCTPEELARWCRAELVKACAESAKRYGGTGEGEEIKLNSNEKRKASRRYQKHLAAKCDAELHSYGFRGEAEDGGPLSSLLCNLMHWADENGINFDDALTSARDHFSREHTFTDDITITEGLALLEQDKENASKQ